MPTPVISGRVALSRYSCKFQPDLENNIEGGVKCFIFASSELGFKEKSGHGVAGKGDELEQRASKNPRRTPRREKQISKQGLKALNTQSSSSSSELSSALSPAFIAPPKSSDSPFSVASPCPAVHISIPRRFLKGSGQTH